MDREIDFKALKIKVASPEDILAWSYGEVTKPETINYRTQRPEKDGLFSERIFGPTKDWECYCGKYRKIRYKGVICDKCGVEVTRSIVRRERMGHIKLATPIVHPWFLRSVPSRIGLALDESLQKLEKVAYYAAYIVTQVDEEKRKAALEEIDREFKSKKSSKAGENKELQAAVQATKETLKSLKPGRVIEEREFSDLGRRFGNVFTVGSGGEGIRKVLEGLDLDKTVSEIEKEMETAKDEMRVKKLLLRLKLFKSMIKNGMRPEWMIMTVLPVLPPDLRPMVALDGGRYATSDLNDLYRRVINRNNRLKKLLELKAPDVIVINEKRMLQEAIDALIDNSTRAASKPTVGIRRPLRSLADMLKGKQGRFRQNLLGKRVDYSGRSVIVVGPNLRHDECGIPKRMALELFRPFVISKIIARGLAYNVKSANRLIDTAPAEVWEILEEVIADKKVLLNRAPTLHRLNIQAFKPILIEDLAIQIPPLVCTGFNADFDGDQMAVHLPLSDEAQAEANNLMLSSKNLLKPASGEAVTYPTQDMVFGCYYLTKIYPNSNGADKRFGSYAEARAAYETGEVAINAPIKVHLPAGEVETSCGRLIFNEVLPHDWGFVNETQTSKSLAKLIGALINRYGPTVAKDTLDKIKLLGYDYATRSGISWSIYDLVAPKEKKAILEEAEKNVALVNDQYLSGFLTDDERKARVIEIWAEVRNEISKIVPKLLEEQSPVYQIVDSGARGSWSQPVLIMGMKGLVVNPQGQQIELPIRSSLKEGHSDLEYFISTHGSRKGMADTALKTAEAGYLTRRLIDVAQDVVVREEDCKTKEGITVYREDGVDFGHSFADRIFGRTARQDIKIGRKVLVEENEIISRELAREIEASGLESIEVRSPITCKSLYGVCARCYGLDLGDNQPIKVGEAVGIIAAQSIGEPGTQLTLKTRHAGGIAAKDITYGLPRVEEIFEVRSPKGKAILSEVQGTVTKIEDRGSLRIIVVKTEKNKKEKLIEYQALRSQAILVNPKDKVAPGDQLTEGSIDLKELYSLKGKEATFRYIIREVQRIYVSEGSPVSNKHIEIILRQMFGRVRIVSGGDTDFIEGDVIDKSKFHEVNRKMKALAKEPARAEEILLGVTKSALNADGWLSAVSFQETARMLIRAASEGRIDHLRGLKENVIIGRLVPVGSTLRGDLKPVEEPEIGSPEGAPQESVDVEA